MHRQGKVHGEAALRRWCSASTGTGASASLPYDEPTDWMPVGRPSGTVGWAYVSPPKLAVRKAIPYWPGGAYGD